MALNMGRQFGKSDSYLFSGRHILECNRFGRQLLFAQNYGPGGTDFVGLLQLFGEAASGNALGREIEVARHACLAQLVGERKGPVRAGADYEGSQARLHAIGKEQ
jgi:hypothetical protein